MSSWVIFSGGGGGISSCALSIGSVAPTSLLFDNGIFSIALSEEIFSVDCGGTHGLEASICENCSVSMAGANGLILGESVEFCGT